MTERIPLDELTSDALDELYNDLDHYEEHVVGELNEANTGLQRQAARAEATLERIRQALAAFDDRGVIRLGHVNLDIPTANEVITAVREALNEPKATTP